MVQSKVRWFTDLATEKWWYGGSFWFSSSFFFWVNVYQRVWLSINKVLKGLVNLVGYWPPVALKDIQLEAVHQVGGIYVSKATEW